MYDCVKHGYGQFLDATWCFKIKPQYVRRGVYDEVLGELLVISKYKMKYRDGLSKI